jgi:hypothetical protein
MEQQELNEIIAKHKLWLEGKEGGIRADLRYADLRDANLRDADLRDANLRDADLLGADLSNANLRDADLRYADLRDADLRDADLRDADLRDANLLGADIIIIKLPIWDAYIHAETVRIGCQHHKHDEWLSFSDEKIQKMDSGAIDWWTEYKPLIVAGIEIIKAQVAKKLAPTVF